MVDRVSLFDEMVEKGVVSPDDVELRVRLGRAQAVSDALGASLGVLARLFGRKPARGETPISNEASGAANGNIRRQGVA